jgi:multiple antibiotic resistance protein
MEFNLIDIFSAFMVLFAVIDIIGSIPIIIDLKKKHGKIDAFKVSLVAFLTLIAFLFVGKSILNIFGVDIKSFAIAGSFILFALSLEMILGIELFKNEPIEDGGKKKNSLIVPLAFPLIAGAGSITSLLSLKAEYSTLNIGIAVFLNMTVVFIVLKSTAVIEKILGQGGIAIMKKIFGIILLSIAIKLFMSNTGLSING